MGTVEHVVVAMAALVFIVWAVRRRRQATRWLLHPRQSLRELRCSVRTRGMHGRRTVTAAGRYCDNCGKVLQRG
jgi:hypothetical protein